MSCVSENNSPLYIIVQGPISKLPTQPKLSKKTRKNSWKSYAHKESRRNLGRGNSKRDPLNTDSWVFEAVVKAEDWHYGGGWVHVEAGKSSRSAAGFGVDIVATSLAVSLLLLQRGSCGSHTWELQQCWSWMKGSWRSICDPGRSICDPGRSICDPGRSICGPGRSISGPGRSICGPLRSLCSPGRSSLNHISHGWCLSVCRLGRASGLLVRQLSRKPWQSGQTNRNHVWIQTLCSMCVSVCVWFYCMCVFMTYQR